MSIKSGSERVPPYSPIDSAPASSRDESPPMFGTVLAKKRLVGTLLFAAILIVFFSFNRFPKLDAVGTDLDAVTAPEVQCFQGFCIDKNPGSSFLSNWWGFSVTYMRLVTVGMTFAFLAAGLTEAFLFPTGSGRSFLSGGTFKRTIKGLAVGPVMNLCSACIVPVSSAFQRRGGGVAGAIAMVQGSATMNVPALAMVFFVFTPLLGFSRLILALVGALIIGPIVVMAIRRGGTPIDDGPAAPETPLPDVASDWGPVLTEAFRDWARITIGYVARMGPIMVVAGFASGLVIQWISPETVSDYLGNDLRGVAIAATIGILINVPLLFEIPLVALLLLLGMGTAPAATLLFTAAAGGPITFWGLSRIMPRRGIATFATATWAVGAMGGLAILGIGAFIWEDGPNLRIDAVEAADAPFFAEVSVAAGVDFLHTEHGDEVMPMGAGVLILDFNGDELHDIYVTNSKGANVLYANNGDGTFTEMAAAAGVDQVTARSNGGCAADFDNDGDQDLYLTNYGQSRLFRNNGDATFADATIPAGLVDSNQSFRSTGCAWGDYDRDGHLDFIVLRHLDEWNKELFETKDYYSAVGGLALYHNNGNGTFTKVTSLLEDDTAVVYVHDLRGEGQALGNVWGAGYQPGWVDFDNDGDLDLYVVNDFGQEVQPNVLWRNDGLGTNGKWSFVDISDDSGADPRIYGMALAVGDYDLNGYLDLFMTNIQDSVLLRNNGDGATFTNTMMHDAPDISLIGLRVRVAWGAVFLDFDNDADEDLYVVSGHLSGQAAANPQEQPNVLLRNRGDGTFLNISPNSGVDDPAVGRGVAYLDFDNDGCLDLYVANLGQTARLFQSYCESGNSWLTIDTVGTASNRDGIGARVTVVTGDTSQIREISSGGGQMSQNMLEAHFGLGRAARVDSVTIKWPSGAVQTLTDVDVNQRLTVTEPR